MPFACHAAELEDDTARDKSECWMGISTVRGFPSAIAFPRRNRAARCWTSFRCQSSIIPAFQRHVAFNSISSGTLGSDQAAVCSGSLRSCCSLPVSLSAPCGLGAAVQRDLWKAPACDQRLGPQPDDRTGWSHPRAFRQSLPPADPTRCASSLEKLAPLGQRPGR